MTWPARRWEGQTADNPSFCARRKFSPLSRWDSRPFSFSAVQIFLSAFSLQQRGLLFWAQEGGWVLPGRRGDREPNLSMLDATGRQKNQPCLNHWRGKTNKQGCCHGLVLHLAGKALEMPSLCGCLLTGRPWEIFFPAGTENSFWGLCSVLSKQRYLQVNCLLSWRLYVCTSVWRDASCKPALDWRLARGK